MTNSTIIADLNNNIKVNAKQLGYTFVRKTLCPDCAAQITQVEEEHNCVLPWANPVCALMFSKKGKPTIIACACGYRGKVEPKAKKEKVYCKSNDCNSILSKKEIEENDGYCWKCKPAQKTSQPAPEKKANMGKAPKAARICKTKGCGNELPEDRKSYCYTCRPKATTTTKDSKEAAQELVM